MPKNPFPERFYTPLKDRIKNACQLAKAAAEQSTVKSGADIHIALKGGLHIWISYMLSASGTGDYFLKLGRQRVEPSAIEWRTVLNNWMWTTNAHNTIHANEGWVYRSALIPDRETRQTKMFDPPMEV